LWLSNGGKYETLSEEVLGFRNVSQALSFFAESLLQIL